MKPTGVNNLAHFLDRLLDTVPFTMHCYSLDWHPKDHISFVENVHMRKLSYESKITDPSRAQTYDTVTFEASNTKILPSRHQLLIFLGTSQNGAGSLARSLCPGEVFCFFELSNKTKNFSSDCMT